MSTSGRVLLISDTELDDPGGRAERFRTRKDHLGTKGWDLSIGYVPEPYILGFPAAVARLTRQARREEVDIVNSVNNPFHLHVIGFLVSVLAGAKWLAEFRDPLVTNPSVEGDPLMPLRRFVERFAVRVADHVVWGDGIQVPKGYYEKTYSDAAENVTRLPFAGYVAEAFESAEPVSYEDFTVTYAGSFYDGWLEPDRFLRGIAEYVRQREQGTDGLTVQFYGDWAERYQRQVEALGIEDYVEHHPFVPHEEIIPVLKGSDVLVYIGGTDPKNRRNVPSKIMDYIGARRPILTLVDESFRVAELIEKHGFGIVVDPRDEAAVANALERLEDGDVTVPDSDETFEAFTRTRKNERLAEVLESLAAE